MGFRDDQKAQRARIEALERELAEARHRNEELSGAAAERDRLREELERSDGRRDEQKRASAKHRAAARAARWAKMRELVASIAGTLTGSKRRREVIVGVGVTLGALLLLARTTGIGCSIEEAGAPSLGLIDLERTPQPVIEPFTVVPTVSSDCSGSFPRAPQLVLRTSRPATIEVAPHTLDGTDLVLAIQTPDGRLVCDDDGGEHRDPLITTVTPPGDTRVWVGTYGFVSWSDVRLDVRAELLPADALDQRLQVLDGPGPASATSMSGSFVPVVQASGLDGQCRGHLPLSPQLVVRLTRPAAVRLDATGPQDLVLAVRGPGGEITCDDDSGEGVNPRIAAQMGAGQHEVFVGSYSRSFVPVPYSLSASALVVDPHAAPESGTRELLPSGEVSISGVGRGEVGPEALGAHCSAGLVGATPHVAISVSRPGEVSLSLTQSTAPFFVVVDTNGQATCFEAPVSRAHWERGQYRVYVGARNGSTPGPFSLSIRSVPSSVEPWSPR